MKASATGSHIGRGNSWVRKPRPHVLSTVSVSSSYQNSNSHAEHWGLGRLNVLPRYVRSKVESGSSGRGPSLCDLWRFEHSAGVSTSGAANDISRGLSHAPVNMEGNNLTEALVCRWDLPGSGQSLASEIRSFERSGSGVESVLGFTEGCRGLSVSGSPHPRAVCPCQGPPPPCPHKSRLAAPVLVSALDSVTGSLQSSVLLLPCSPALSPQGETVGKTHRPWKNSRNL